MELIFIYCSGHVRVALNIYRIGELLGQERLVFGAPSMGPCVLYAGSIEVVNYIIL